MSMFRFDRPSDRGYPSFIIERDPARLSRCGDAVWPHPSFLARRISTAPSVRSLSYGYARDQPIDTGVGAAGMAEARSRGMTAPACRGDAGAAITMGDKMPSGTETPIDIPIPPTRQGAPE